MVIDLHKICGESATYRAISVNDKSGQSHSDSRRHS